MLGPRSKLATARDLGSEAQADSLGEELRCGDVAVEELYGAMDRLLLRRKRIERTLAAKPIADGSLVLCDRDGCPVAAEVFPGNTAAPAPWPPRSRSCARASRCHTLSWPGTGTC